MVAESSGAVSILCYLEVGIPITPNVDALTSHYTSTPLRFTSPLTGPLFSPSNRSVHHVPNRSEDVFPAAIRKTCGLRPSLGCRIWRGPFSVQKVYVLVISHSGVLWVCCLGSLGLAVAG